MKEIALLFIFFMGLLALQESCRRPIHKYVGTVIKLTPWEKHPIIKTKGKFNQDTLVEIYPRGGETFEIGQILTCWTGGTNLNTTMASTSPPR